MRYLVEIKAYSDGPLNIGAGAMGGTIADRPMLTDVRGLPFIPGSTLKGCLRAMCTQLAQAMNRPTCKGPRAEAMCQPAEGEPPCVICRLFGSPWRPSSLLFGDLKLVEPAFLQKLRVPPPTSLRYGVGLSRRRRVAEDHLLYTTEVFLPGSTITFEGVIEGMIGDEADLGLLLAGLRELTAFGGSKSTGMGWCDLEVTAYRSDAANKVTLDTQELVGRWLRC